MKYFLFLFLLNINLILAQKTLPYNNYIDYYRNEVKSCILTKDGNFLKDGKYRFEGNSKDFKFLLSYVLQYDIDDFKPNDTLVYVGEIKDSLKVNIWHLTTKRKGKDLSLIYHKQEKIIVSGVNFNDKFGLINEMINLKSFDKDESLNYFESGGIFTYYFFGDNPVNIKKNESYSEKSKSFVSEFYVTSKKNNKFIYSETSSSFKENSANKKSKQYKDSFLQYNDSCSLKIENIIVIENNKKINKTIYNQIDFNEKSNNKTDHDYIVVGDKKHCGISIVEKICKNKLIDFKIKYENNETIGFFSEILKTNFFPTILYEISNALVESEIKKVH